HISRAVSSDPYLWIQEQTIKNNENSLNLYTYNANQEPYKAKQLDLQKSKTDLANMKDKLRKSLLLKYNQLNQLEEKYKVTELQLAQVEQNLDIMRKQFDLGMITRLELNDLELTVAQIQYNLDAMAIQHKTLKTTLEKPYLVPDYV
ncbi:MAG: TolC family protein, partial [Thermotaleaceae bacterium]